METFDAWKREGPLNLCEISKDPKNSSYFGLFFLEEWLKNWEGKFDLQGGSPKNTLKTIRPGEGMMRSAEMEKNAELMRKYAVLFGKMRTA